MINGVRFKVCGITSGADAELAANAGADFLGFIFHPRSPRFISLESYRALKPSLPRLPKVAVVVEPSLDELRRLAAEGFDAFQIHYPDTTPLDRIASWSEAATPEKLWLAPRVPPGTSLEPAQLALAHTILFDTYQTGTYGGTGKTGDWAAYVKLRENHPRLNWILAGGLNPENIAAALASTGARIIDVNSGVESVPGIKSAEKLKRFRDALRSTPVAKS